VRKQMIEGMKILIAYDGSECGDAALDDLRRAGLPNGAEALVMTVADVFLPPPINEEVDNTFPFYVPTGIRRAHERAAEAVKQAEVLAQTAGDRLRSTFPNWKVRTEACADSPGWAVVRKADEWHPDLVVVGSHGHSALGGWLILGSVSQRILYEARCSVRVARGRPYTQDSPVRVIVGVDNSPNSEAALSAVASRAWVRGTEVRLVAVLDTVMLVRPDPSQPAVFKWLDVNDERDWNLARQMFEASADKLRAAGLTASVDLREGNPKQVLVDEAESWGADSIFVGAKGIRGIDRFLLGSVSAAVAARAHCSVEVIRPEHVTG
jgi:nucleotide-binding universal stress UspA family protein